MPPDEDWSAGMDRQSCLVNSPAETAGRALRLESSLRCTDGARIDVSIDGRLEAICILREKVRVTAPDVIAELREQGLRVSVSTGDRSERGIAAGFDSVTGELAPQDKARMVDAWTKPPPACPDVGDGINDAPARARVHAAIALLSGTELARAAAAGNPVSPQSDHHCVCHRRLPAGGPDGEIEPVLGRGIQCCRHEPGCLWLAAPCGSRGADGWLEPACVIQIVTTVRRGRRGSRLRQSFPPFLKGGAVIILPPVS